MRLVDIYKEYKWWIWIGLILIFNLLISNNPSSIDLTEDKRFSLSTETKALLAKQDQRILVEVLYDGDFPAGYKRLQLAVVDMLRKMKSYHTDLVIRSEDPTDGDGDEVNARMQAFAKMGLVPIPISFPGSKEFRATQAFPYVVFSQGDKTVIVPILENTNIGGYDEEKLNEAVAALEYKFANAIQKINQSERRKIGIIQKPGGLSQAGIYGLQKELSKFYQVGNFSLDSVALINPEIEVLLVPSGSVPYEEKEIFALDQYVMQGGNIIWMVDPLQVSIDSIRRRGEYAPYASETGLENLLFRYGIRVNPDLVIDLNAGTIPLATGSVGGKPQFDFFPWYYHIIPQPSQGHSITKNIGEVKLYFPSSIDTLRTESEIKKSILLSTSENSKRQALPRALNFEISRYPPEVSYFDDNNIPLAVLLEGQFTSFFKNRLTSEWRGLLRDYGQSFQEKSKSAIQMVIADLDFIKTKYAGANGVELPVGYDYFEKKEYSGNLDLMINTIEYMMGNGALLQAKAKKVKLRLLDTKKANNEKSKWQLINLALPLVCIALLGLLFNFSRRRKYG